MASKAADEMAVRIMRRRYFGRAVLQPRARGESYRDIIPERALESERVRDGLKDVLLGPALLYEALRDKGANRPATP